MKTKLSAQDAIDILVNSDFKPYHCVAEAWDNQFPIKVNFLDGNNKSVLKIEELLRDQFTDGKRLHALILDIKKRLK